MRDLELRNRFLLYALCPMLHARSHIPHHTSHIIHESPRSSLVLVPGLCPNCCEQVKRRTLFWMLDARCWMLDARRKILKSTDLVKKPLGGVWRMWWRDERDEVCSIHFSPDLPSRPISRLAAQRERAMCRKANFTLSGLKEGLRYSPIS